MDSRKISFLLPSAYRPRELRRAIDTIFDSINQPAEICVSIVADDPASRSVVDQAGSVTFDTRSPADYQRGAVWAWNRLYRKATGDVIALWADDLVPEPGWLEHALKALDQIGGHGLIGLNDLSSDGDIYAAHWLADRAFVEDELRGVMYPPMYRSWWADREVTDRAREMGRYRWARRAIVEHLNYTFGKARIDRTYQDARANYETDRIIYEMRKADGFPDWRHDEDFVILPAQSQPAAPVAKDRRRHPKGSMARADRLLADGE
jgi:glycosyltransferase involved in cell wall biosynthesis